VSAPSDTWSDQARVLVRPFAAYRALADDTESPGSAIFARLFVLMIALGAFVSFTAAGRLVPLHMMSPAIAWAYIPLLQLACIAVVRLGFARTHNTLRVYALYLAGHGGWMLLLLAIAAVCLLSPNAPGALLWLLRSGVIPVAVVVNFVWGIVITFALFRSALGLPRRVSGSATACFYALYAGSIASWFLVTGQLHTLFQR